MAERPISVVVDEILHEDSEKSYLIAELIADGKIRGQFIFGRSASPEQISKKINEVGYFIKYEGGELQLSKERKFELGNLFIEASHNVPGLEKK